MARIGWGRIIAGAVGVAAAGATYFYLRERASETPEHQVLRSSGPFELRRYPALLVAETVQTGTRDRALGNGFGLLADYIFAESRGGEEIAMTAPVLASAEGENDWRVRFIMPKVWTRETLPEPGPGVTIGELPGRRMAAVKFGGRADDASLGQREAELRGWIEAEGLIPVRGAEHAFYNSPFIPGPLRHNEVLIEVG